MIQVMLVTCYMYSQCLQLWLTSIVMTRKLVPKGKAHYVSGHISMYCAVSCPIYYSILQLKLPNSAIKNQTRVQ